MYSFQSTSIERKKTNSRFV